MARRQLTGVVIKKSGTKTVSVLVSSLFMHPKYKKTITSSKKYLAHDESDLITAGTKVTIEESRPISSKKKFVVISNNESVI